MSARLLHCNAHQEAMATMKKNHFAVVNCANLFLYISFKSRNFPGPPRIDP